MMRHSATQINFANYCRRRYFLRYVLKDEQLNLSVYRRGTLVHNLVYNPNENLGFWDKLGKPEEIKRNKHGKVISKKKYSNPDEFISYAQGQWLRMLKQDEFAGREIDWRFDKEMWEIRNGYLPKVCRPLFGVLVEEGRPLESELKFDFVLGGRRFNGKIDEVRIRNEEVLIRDYKTESPWIGEMKLSGNPQLTLYCVGLCALCHKDEEFASRLGLADERERFMGNPIYISGRVKAELFMIDTLTKDPETVRNMPQLIYPTERTDKDFSELLMGIEDIERAVRQFRSGKVKRIPSTERGKKCDYCDMKKACVKKLEEELGQLEQEKMQEEFFKDKGGQLHFSFVSPYSHKQPKTRYRQKRFRWPRRKAR